MYKKTIACRICGKQFVPCNKSSASLGAFNYHSVACCPECGAEYFRRVQEARKQPEQSEAANITGQINIDESFDMNIVDEFFENDVEKIVEQVVKQEMKSTRFKKNKQEINEK